VPLVNLPAPRTYQLPTSSPADASAWLAAGGGPGLAPLAGLVGLAAAAQLVALLGEGLLALAPWQIRVRD